MHTDQFYGTRSLNVPIVGCGWKMLEKNCINSERPQCEIRIENWNTQYGNWLLLSFLLPLLMVFGLSWWIMVGQTHTGSGRCQGHAFNARAAVKDDCRMWTRDKQRRRKDKGRGTREKDHRTHTPSLVLPRCQQAAGGWQQKSNEFIIYCPHICLQLSVKEDYARSRHLQDLLWTPNPLLFSYGFQFVSSHSSSTDSDRCILFQNRGGTEGKDASRECKDSWD